ncbi:hypothetical protein GGR58DRAFT_507727 [Xylaria digitata]|nr:hypothetical protein GGR58DRAFT_507727 [Xylaria digitata]
MDSAEFRTAAKTVIDEIADYYDNVADHGVISSVESGYLRPQLLSHAPLKPELFSAIHADALSLLECFLNGGSTYNGGIIHSIVSKAIVTVIAATRDQYLADVTGQIPTVEKTADSSGSENSIEGAAREDKLWRRRSRLVALGSACSHSNTKKAAQIFSVRYISVPISEESG